MLGTMSSLLSVLAATTKDVDAAAEALALAHEHDPWAAWVLPEENRLARLFELQRLYLTHALEHGLVLVTPQGTGAIAMLPPDAPDPDDAAVDRLLALHGDRIDRLTAPSTPHPDGAWTVESLGVHPDHLHQGIGSALVIQALLRMRAIDTGAVVTTYDDRNLKFFGRYGFTLTHHHHDTTSPESWTLHRPA